MLILRPVPLWRRKPPQNERGQGWRYQIMMFTAIQIQSLIVCGVIILVAMIVWPFAVKIEKEEENERRQRIMNRYK